MTNIQPAVEAQRALMMAAAYVPQSIVSDEQAMAAITPEALEALLLAQVWRPMSEAPKDGTQILVDTGDDVWKVQIVSWGYDEWRTQMDGPSFYDTDLKGWMPTPKAS